MDGEKQMRVPSGQVRKDGDGHHSIRLTMIDHREIESLSPRRSQAQQERRKELLEVVDQGSMQSANADRFGSPESASS